MALFACYTTVHVTYSYAEQRMSIMDCIGWNDLQFHWSVSFNSAPRMFRSAENHHKFGVGLYFSSSKSVASPACEFSQAFKWVLVNIFSSITHIIGWGIEYL